jgi:hypothetical protein
MDPATPFKEELELDAILEKETELFRRRKEFEENQRRIERERAERECMIPPLDDIATRTRMKAHQAATTRGEVKNVHRNHNENILMLILLLAATCSLIWWSFKLMQGT